MSQRFLVRSKHFSLYQAFKTEAEKLGWKYLDNFSAFEELNAKNVGNCLFFSYQFQEAKGKPAFSLSHSLDNDSSPKTFNLETDWEAALAHAKEALPSRKITTTAGIATVTADFKQPTLIEISVRGKLSISGMTVKEAIDLNEALGALLEQFNQC